MDQRVQYMPFEEVLVTQGDGHHKRRMPTQDLIRHVLVLCGAKVPQGRALGGKHGKTATRGTSEDRERKRNRKGSDAGGASKLRAVSQRLLERGRDGRECASGAQDLQQQETSVRLN